MNRLSYYRQFLAYRVRKLISWLRNIPLVMLCSGLLVGAVLGFGVDWRIVLCTSSVPFVLFAKWRLLLLGILVGALLCGNSLETLQRQGAELSNLQQLSLQIDSITSRTEFKQNGIGHINQNGAGVFLSLPRYPELSPGDLVSLDNFDFKPTQENTELKTYLLGKGLSGIISSKSLILIESANNPYPRVGPVEVLRAEVQSYLPSPNSTLLMSIIFGTEPDLPKELKQEFADSGLSHVMAVSGYNFNLISLFLLGLAGLLHRRWVILLTITIQVLFLAMVGFDNLPALRAVLMASYSLIALWWGYKNYLAIGLLCSAALIVFCSPLSWLSLSFQLSFLATLGLMLFGSKLNMLCNFRPAAIAEGLSATLAVNLLTLPLLWLNFGQFSFSSFIANLVVVPLVPAVMICGLLAMFIALIIPAIGGVVFLPVELLLDLLRTIVHFFASLPGAVSQNSLLVMAILLGISMALIYADFRHITAMVWRPWPLQLK